MSTQPALLLQKVFDCIPQTGTNRSSHEDFGKSGSSVQRASVRCNSVEYSSTFGHDETDVFGRDSKIQW